MPTELLERTVDSPVLNAGSGSPPEIPRTPTVDTGGLEPTWSENDVENLRRIARSIETGNKLELNHNDAVTLHIIANLIEGGTYDGV